MREKSIDELVNSITQTLVDLFSEGIEDLELVKFSLYEIFRLTAVQSLHCLMSMII